jgi:hypothetical protein
MADVERNGEEGRITNNSNDPPPSYESTFNRLKSVKDESSGPGDCFQKFVTVLCGSVIGTIAIGLVLAVPLAMIIVGAIHLKDCPIERFIPIYLIVGGCFGVVQSLMTTSFRVRNQRKKKEEDNAKPHPASGIISCFLFAWFIAGSVWVYRIFHTVTMSNSADPTYCHAGTYWFTFVLITAGYVAMALSLCCCLSIGAVAMCVGSTKKPNESSS